MDTSILSTIVIAILAFVPGVIALIDQIKKDRANTAENLQRVAFGLSSSLMEEVNNLRMRTDGLQDNTIRTEARIENLMNGDKMFEKMYEKPVIIRCGYCHSPNVISNVTCTQCGAPLK